MHPLHAVHPRHLVAAVRACTCLLYRTVRAKTRNQLRLISLTKINKIGRRLTESFERKKVGR